MEKNALVWIIVAIAACVLAGVGALVAWQLGAFKPKSKRIPPPPGPSGEPQVGDIRASEAPADKSLLERDLQIAAAAEETRTIDDVIAAWLTDGSPDYTPDHSSPAYVADVVLVAGAWNCTRSQLLPGAEALSEGDRFGYAVDSQAQVTIVTAPGTGSGDGVAYVFGGNLKFVQKIDAPAKGERFGTDCVLSPSATMLFVQSDSSVYVYTRTLPQCTYSFSVKLELTSDIQILKCSPENTLWVSNQKEGTTHILGRSQVGEWTVVADIPVLTMQIAFDPKTQYVWAATSEGVTHWSRNNRGEWIENARWLESMALTSVEQFVPINSANSYLLLGEAQNDCVSVVSALDPNTMLDRVVVPGGSSGVAGASEGLFGDRVVSFGGLVVVSAPLDGVYPIKNAGCIVVYQLTDDAKLLPVAMVRSAQMDSMSQFGSYVRVHDSKTLLVSAPGAKKGRGGVDVFSLV